MSNLAIPLAKVVCIMQCFILIFFQINSLLLFGDSGILNLHLNLVQT